MTEHRTPYLVAASDDAPLAPGLARAIDELGGLPPDVEIDPAPIVRRRADRPGLDLALIDLVRTCALVGVPKPVLNHRWMPLPVGWTFAVAWPEILIAIDVQDGSGRGWVVELARLNAAAVAGWCVLRVTPAQLADGLGLRLARDAMHARGPA